jgi:hypothetical protein
MRVAVYSAIFGGYDSLKQPVAQNVACDFICFTDSLPAGRNGAWQLVHVPTGNIHPRMQAKYFKLMSHDVFPDGRLARQYANSPETPQYDFTVWIDGRGQIVSETFIQDITAVVDESGWALFRHSRRDCIYDEAEVSLQYKKYHTVPIREQVESYRQQGHPAHGGLYECGIIARREPLFPRLREANVRWWEENLGWTYQDQLSLPVVLREDSSRAPAIIPGAMFNNHWTAWDEGHNSED